MYEKWKVGEVEAWNELVLCGGPSFQMGAS